MLFFKSRWLVPLMLCSWKLEYITLRFSKYRKKKFPGISSGKLKTFKNKLKYLYTRVAFLYISNLTYTNMLLYFSYSSSKFVIQRSISVSSLDHKFKETANTILGFAC